jgi:hypothetical protein
MTSVRLRKGKTTKLSEGKWISNIIVHFEGCSKPFPKWFSDASIHNIYSPSNHGAKGVPPTQEMTVVTWHRALADKCRRAQQEEEKALSDAAE